MAHQEMCIIIINIIIIISASGTSFSGSLKNYEEKIRNLSVSRLITSHFNINIAEWMGTEALHWSAGLQQKGVGIKRIFHDSRQYWMKFNDEKQKWSLYQSGW